MTLFNTSFVHIRASTEQAKIEHGIGLDVTGDTTLEINIVIKGEPVARVLLAPNHADGRVIVFDQEDLAHDAEIGRPSCTECGIELSPNSAGPMCVVCNREAKRF